VGDTVSCCFGHIRAYGVSVLPGNHACIVFNDSMDGAACYIFPGPFVDVATGRTVRRAYTVQPSYCGG
jgi:hypothetical protein